jgi:hypothetical protein
MVPGLAPGHPATAPGLSPLGPPPTLKPPPAGVFLLPPKGKFSFLVDMFFFLDPQMTGCKNVEIQIVDIKM